MNRFALALISASVIAGCSQMESKAPPKMVKDGELAVPADYKTWPKFLSDVQRPDAKQVRDIYVNPVGAKATPGKPFPEGTIFVMENFAVKQGPDGTLTKGPDGKLVKAQLLRVFVMGKGKGWGESVTTELRNGDWIYASYLSDGKPSGDPLAACRSCHLPLASKDYVHRYDEYFQTRAAIPAAKPSGGYSY
jgi:hemoglobin